MVPGHGSFPTRDSLDNSMSLTEYLLLQNLSVRHPSLNVPEMAKVHNSLQARLPLPYS